MSDRPDGLHGADGPARFGAGGAEDPWAKAPAETFPVALRVVPVRIRQDLEAVYRYARHVDDIGDTGDPGAETPTDRSAVLDRLAGIEADIRALYHGDPVNNPVVADLASLVARQRVPADPLLRLVESNRRDQRVHRYETFGGPARPLPLLRGPRGRTRAARLRPGHRRTRPPLEPDLYGTPAAGALAGRGRGLPPGPDHLPREDLRAFSVGEVELAQPRASEALRALIAFERPGPRTSWRRVRRCWARCRAGRG